MLFNIVINAMKLGRNLTSYAVSRLGVKRFAAELAGFVVIEETIDFAAEHSEWVRENKNSLLAITILGGVTGNALRSLRVPSSYSKLATGLFSKVQIRNSASAIAAMANTITASIRSNGFRLTFNGGKDFIDIARSRDGKQLLFKHSGHIVTSMLLAGGFGAGAGRVLDGDVSSSALQMQLVLADLLSTHAEDALENKLLSHDAMTLLSHGPSIIRSFLRENPGFSPEKAVAALELSKMRDEKKVGEFTIFSFVDSDDVEVHEVNGTSFRLADGKLKQYDSKGQTNKPLSEDGLRIAALLLKFYQAHSYSRNFEFYPIQDTRRGISEMVTFDGFAMALVWDEDSRSFEHWISETSLLDSAEENLIDATEASLVEEGSAFYDSVVRTITGGEEVIRTPMVLDASLVAGELGKL